ncbi:MAG: substrate-binding domain-containing protein, partial [Chloroflexota bacterium]|nr:substrate-binding domain-containing protein [Chloroflexota bacterium]
MEKHGRGVLLIAVLLAALLVLAGCGGQAQPVTEPAPTEAPAEEETQAEEEEPAAAEPEPTEEPTEETEETEGETTEESEVEVSAGEEADEISVEGTTGEAREMVFITHDMHPFFVPTIVGMSDACQAVGWDCSFIGPPSFSVEGTAQRLESTIATGPDAIGMVFSDPEAYNSLVEDALEQGITVVGYNTDNDFRADMG